MLDFDGTEVCYRFVISALSKSILRAVNLGTRVFDCV